MAAICRNEAREFFEKARRPAEDIRDHSACGVGVAVDLQGRATREAVRLALTGLKDMEARGGSIDGTGDGAGIMVRTKGMRKFLERGMRKLTSVPADEELFSGHFFFGREEAPNLQRHQERIDGTLRKRGLAALGWRQVPTKPEVLGARARETMPLIWQLVFAQGNVPDASLRESLQAAQLMIEDDLPSVYPVSLEPGTMVLKAMSTSGQFEQFFPDLEDPDFVTDAALWHRRFSTVALARWPLAQPFSLLGHNGEVNSIRSMRESARNLKRIRRMSKKVLMRGGSDSGDVDKIVHLSHSRGVPLDEALRRLVQPAADDVSRMTPNVGDYHRAVRRCSGPSVEGPAGIVAMDRDKVVGILDGMGLRPVRVIETNSGVALIASEVGAPAIPHADIKQVRQLGAGQMVIIESGKIHYGEDAENLIVNRTAFNYKEVARKEVYSLPSEGFSPERLHDATTVRMLNLFGFDRSRVELLSGMFAEGKEPVKGMGNDQPLAVFSKNSPPLSRYIRQTTTDVTNPALDPLREGGAFDLRVLSGARPRALEHGFKYEPFTQVEFPHPIMSADQIHSLSGHEFDTTFQGDGADDLRNRLYAIVRESLSLAKDRKSSVFVFTDRGVQGSADSEVLYVPPLLVVSAVHQALIENGFRRNVSLVVDSGEVLEAHDAAVLIGNGADAVSPWLLWEYARSGLIRGADPKYAEANAMKAMAAGIKKVMAKMGIISLEGFRGARLFEAVGLSPDLVDYYLTGMPSRVGGIGLEDILRDLKRRSAEAKTSGTQIRQNRDSGAYNKQNRAKLIASGMPGSDVRVFEDLMSLIDGQDPIYLRDMLGFDPQAVGIPIEEVMSAADILAHHIRGAAMSHGALSFTAHRAIAAAFNELGGMSNAGEGGEDGRRNRGGDLESERSKIRQVASGRFGVDALYLMNADEVEIKISQGAKPREGGHLPGAKVTAEIAALRRASVGQDLISPPPHHDVYSIEDLALLIQNIRAVNPNVKISVKIASSADCGVVGVGVAKAGGDNVCISGGAGGTGAAALSSKEHAGLPIEIGLADVHQFLVENGLRDFVKIRVDEGIKTSDDFIKLVLMGADEVALGTVLLVAGEGCVFCRGCSKGCDIGICAAEGGDEQKMQEYKHQIMHFLELFSESVRKKLASLGFHSVEEATGRVDKLRQISKGNERADKLDLSFLLRSPYQASQIVSAVRQGAARTLSKPAVNRGNEELCAAVAGGNLKYEAELSVHERSFGATLAGKIATGEIKLDGKKVEIETTENAGQSIGFCMVEGMEIRHTGFANDMVGGSMSGGKLILRLPEHLKDAAGANSIIGNSCAYGATGGLLYAEGTAGQRLGVRNSGATIVAEGAGKYAFEYMTGGTGVLLGDCGGDIGAGMTGGELFMFDEKNSLKDKIDSDSVEVKELDEAACARLHTVLEDYFKETNSKKAGLILNDWDTAKKVFKMVVPKARA